MLLEIDDILSLIACPICKHELTRAYKECFCTNAQCSARFPIINNIPILINENNSLFKIKEIIESNTSIDYKINNNIKNFFRKIGTIFIPSINHNMLATRNYSLLAQLLSEMSHSPTVLVIGAGELGEGEIKLLEQQGINIIRTDVYLSPNISLIADGHDLPFFNESLDAVVIQAVLEHVVNPSRCVAEIHRVLKPAGIVYSETPFMYPVHMGAYDFTRFSMCGQRTLFRNFAEIDSDMIGGPGMALALSIRSFVLSFGTSYVIRFLALVVLPFFIFWLKYLDYLLIRNKHAVDFAATLCFLGRKIEQPITYEEAIKSYWARANPKSQIH